MSIAFSSPNSASTIVGASFNFQVAAAEAIAPAGDPGCAFTATGVPAGLTLQSDGLITGAATTAGIYTVTVTATDGSDTASQTLTITVAAASITSPAAASGTVGAAFSYQITANNQPTSFAAPGLPANLAINASTGLISGTPIAAGTSAIALTASNASGSATLTLTITVSAQTATPPGVPGSAPTGFLTTASPGSAFVVPPVFLGTAAGNKGVPAPDETLSINDFGLDVAESSWACRTAIATTLKPDLYDAHPELPNMYCVGSMSMKGEALMSKIHATYKGLVKGTVRPWKPSMSEDTDPQTLTFNNGISATAGGNTGSGDSQASAAQNTITFPNIPVPQPVYTLKGASLTVPNMNALGAYFASPPGCPPPPSAYKFPAYGQAAIDAPLVLIATLVFIPNPQGWLCDRLEFTQAGYAWEVTQQWRLSYVVHDYIYPTSSGQVGSFTVYPTTCVAGQSISVAFTGSNTNWTTDQEFFTNGGTISGLAVNTAQQVASGTFTAPTYATVVTFGASGIDSTNTITVTAS